MERSLGGIEQWNGGQRAETDAQEVTPECEEFLTMRVTEHRTRLPQEVMASPSLEIFKIHLDTNLSNML